MRYWVYRDNQILGPFAPQDLPQAGGLRHDTLICEESATGKSDGDWRPLKDVPELSGVRVLEPAFFDEAPPGLGPGGLERLELDALGVPEDEEQGAAWIRTLFEDADFRNRFAGLLPRSEDDPQQLSLAKSRIAQLTGELEALRARLGEVENARHAQWKTVELPKILESAVTLPPPPPEPKPAAAQPQAADQEAAVIPPVKAPKGLRLRIAGAAPLGGASPLPSAEPVRGLRLKISSGGGLPVAQPAPSGEEELLPPGVRPIELKPLAEAGPANGPLEPVVAAAAVPSPGLEPAPILLEPPSPANGPLEPVWQPPAETSSLQAVPLPPLPMAAPPLTAVFGPGDQPAAAAGFGAVPLDLAAAPAAGPVPTGPAIADVVARLAKPAPTQAPSPKPPRRGVSRAVLIALFVLTGAVAGAFFLFLRNPKDLKTMVAMGSDQKPLGVESAEEAAPQPAPAQAPAQPAIQPPAAVSTPASAPPATASQPEGGDAAVALVKGFPLDGDRGTVGQWLQYSYAANPGDGNKEEWTAGGLDATTYLVQYQVHAGPSASPVQNINYVFEADAQRKTVRGHTENARQLLAGGEPAAARKAASAKPKRKTVARRPKRKPAVRRDENKPLALLPLPTDAELVPPAEDDSSFQDPTVLRQPGQ